MPGRGRSRVIAAGLWKTRGNMSFYGPDLAFAHDAGFGFWARGATPGLLRLLRRRPLRSPGADRPRAGAGRHVRARVAPRRADPALPGGRGDGRDPVLRAGQGRTAGARARGAGA